MEMKEIGLIILGVGAVGRSLARQAQRMGFPVVGIADSKGLTATASNEEMIKLIEAKESTGEPVGKNMTLKEVKAKSGLSSFAVADCSATYDTVPFLLEAVSSGDKIALANKKPMSEDLETFATLSKARKQAKFESVCGAGLPVITSVSRLVNGGDVPTKIEGLFSGSLGFIMSELDKNEEPFSSIVLKAKGMGFTEPDPRDDLSGTDVARKALILSRLIGGSLSLKDIEIEAMYPEAYGPQHMDTATFIKRMPELDEAMKARIQSAAADNKKLRYMAQVNGPNEVKVGFQEVAAGSPAFGLGGTTNLVSIQTPYYVAGSEMVISGPGAGVEVTAGGVLSDICELI